MTRKMLTWRLPASIFICLCLSTGMPAQVPADAGEDLVHVDPGHVSGNTYTNDAFGFSYEFPAGWEVFDKTKQDKTINQGHEEQYGDSLEAAREHEMAMRCMRILLWASKPAPDAKNTALNPGTILFAYAPSCFPGVKFPTSSEDKEGIKQSVTFLRQAFSNSPLMDQGKQETRTFTLQNHLFLEITVSGQAGSDPKSPSEVHAAILLTPLKDYWLAWMLASNTDSGLRELKKLKIKFQGSATK